MSVLDTDNEMFNEVLSRGVMALIDFTNDNKIQWYYRNDIFTHCFDCYIKTDTKFKDSKDGYLYFRATCNNPSKDIFTWSFITCEEAYSIGIHESSEYGKYLWEIVVRQAFINNKLPKISVWNKALTVAFTIAANHQINLKDDIKAFKSTSYKNSVYLDCNGYRFIVKDKSRPRYSKSKLNNKVIFYKLDEPYLVKKTRDYILAENIRGIYTNGK